MALGSNVSQLWQQFNKTDPEFSKGQALLEYMYLNETATEGAKKKVMFKLWPGAPEPVCASCWRLCAGFAKDNGAESSLYGKVRSSFNAGRYTPWQEPGRSNPEPTDNLKVRVVAFLQAWLEENSDPIPEDTACKSHGPPRVHVDVPRKTDIWEACCEHLDKHYPDPIRKAGKPPISETWFRKLLNEQVHVVIHKHKKFSQCVTCFLFKQLMAKCTNLADKAEIREHRRTHFETVFRERVIYHKTRTYAKENPEEVLSMILDAQTAWRTRGPTLPRDIGSGFPNDFEPFGQQLYGCLVHALPGDVEHPGGFYGYMVDDSVKGGGNVTCEIVYETLKKLQEQREVWPPVLDIRLDNTTKDNKNKCVFGFFAWLVLTDVFKKVRVRYLSVGHTHEDIDALFGILMQYLYRNQCFATIEILMDAIYDSFFVRDARHASGNRPSAKVQHMRATHNWTGWLTTVCEEQVDEANKIPVRKMEKYARRVPDSHRPHEFEFTKMIVEGGECVVVNYKHWCADQEFWNTEPILVFNYKPDVQHLLPAELNPNITKQLSKCVAGPDFSDHTAMCSKASGPKGDNGEYASSNLKNCPRCRVHIAFGVEHRSGAVFCDSDRDAWSKRWANLTQDSANASLSEIKELRTYNLQEPRLPFVLPKCMQGPSAGYLSVPPVTYAGYTEAMYKKLLRQAGVGVGLQGGSTVSYAVQEVIGVHRSAKGVLSVAVVWTEDNGLPGGTWNTMEDLNASFLDPEDDDDEAEDDDDVPSKEQMEQDLEASVQAHNWNLYFGTDVDEDLNIICGFSDGPHSTAYQGVVMAADYDESTGLHQIHFPVMPADALFGTASQQEKDDYIHLRMDNLALSSDNNPEHMNYWVKRDFVALPFLQDLIKTLNLDLSGKNTTTRKKARRNATISSSDEEQPLKQSKPKSGGKPPFKKMTKAQAETYDLLQQMRSTPL
tara:strand:- start:190 stop:3027 length:2838 start_codon:yes stop_codon:yes gene_type:complete